MRSRVVHQCSSLCGPRFEVTILSRTQPLDFSDLSVIISRPNKKIIAFVINSQVPLIKLLQYACALFVNIPLNVIRNVPEKSTSWDHFGEGVRRFHEAF
jgi:hypothetical protein